MCERERARERVRVRGCVRESESETVKRDNKSHTERYTDTS